MIMRKPKKIPRPIKQAIAQVLRENLLERLPQLSTPEEASELESSLYTLRTAGILTDTEYNLYAAKIKEICKENNWAMP